MQGAPVGGRYTGQSRQSLGLDLSDRETPQSVSVITRGQLEDFGLRTVNDALAHATGLTVEHFETDRSYFTARGFDITNFLFDGVGMPFTNGNQLGDLDTAVFEQVDILRGANGLLSATGNPSATVSFVRKRPTAKPFAAASPTLGSWHDRRSDFDVSGPLTSGGILRGRLIASAENTDAYLDRHGVRKRLLTGLLDFDLDPATHLNVGHLEQHSDTRRPMWGALPLVYADGGPIDHRVSASTAPDWSYWNNADRRTHAEVTHDFANGWQARAVALHRTVAYGSDLLYVYGLPDRQDGSDLVADAARATSHSRQKLVDLRLGGPIELGGRIHEALLGFNWGHEQTRAHTDHAATIALPPTDFSHWDGRVALPVFAAATSFADFHSGRRSLYGALHLRPTARLGVILGGNLNRVESDGVNYGAETAYRHSVATPYAGVVFEPNDNLSAYASFSRIFNPQSEVDANRQILAPVQGSNLEVGMKSAWLENRLAVSLAVYRSRQQNAAEYAGTLSDARPCYRGVDATATGFEVDLTGRPLPGWELSAGLAQLRLRDQEGHAARRFIPRRSLHLATSHRLSMLPALRLGAALRWQSATRTVVDDTIPVVQKAYGVLDLMARLDFHPNLHLILNVSNASNQKYLNSLYWQWAYYGAPRSASATLHWNH